MGSQYEKKVDENFKLEENFLDYDNPPHFHRAIEVSYVLKKNYEVCVQNKTYNVKANEILIISSRMTHSAKPQDSTKIISLILPYEYFSYFPKLQHTTIPCYILQDKNYNKQVLLPLLKLFLTQEGPYSNQDIKSAYDTVLLGWTNLLFGKSFNFYTLDFPIGESNELSFSEQILFFIDNNYMRHDLSLQTIADVFGYNPSYLSRTFKKYFFVPLNKYIRSVRIRKFISLYFMAPDANILKLAMQCGFSTSSAFYRAFHEETNCSPMQFHQLNKNQVNEAGIPQN